GGRSEAAIGDAARRRQLPGLSARAAPRGHQGLGRDVPAARGAPGPRCCRRRAAPHQGRSLPRSAGPIAMSSARTAADEEALAAAWAASLENQDGTQPAAGDADAGAEEFDSTVSAARVLNQNEIDSLLGFDDGAANDGD